MFPASWRHLVAEGAAISTAMIDYYHGPLQDILVAMPRPNRKPRHGCRSADAIISAGTVIGIVLFRVLPCTYAVIAYFISTSRFPTTADEIHNDTTSAPSPRR